MSQPVSNHVKIGSSGINSISIGNFSIGVKGGADYGPTSDTGFYNGIPIPVGGYVIYVEKSSQGPSIHAPRTDEECILYLNKYGANASNISDALTWASTQSNLLVRTSEYQLGDLPTSPSFTLSSTDFTTASTGYGATGDNTYFTISGSHGSGESLYSADLQTNIPKADELYNFFVNNNLTVNNNAYLFDVSWGLGSTLSSGVVVVSFYYWNNTSVWLNIGTVDTTISGWDTQGADIYNTLRASEGTFYLPATFTLRSPIIIDNDSWC